MNLPRGGGQFNTLGGASSQAHHKHDDPKLLHLVVILSDEAGDLNKHL